MDADIDRYFADGVEAFAVEDYKRAVELYSRSLHEINPRNVNCLLNRAHAYIKLEQFGKAKADADLAVDVSRKAGKPDIVAFLRSGVASFHLGKYAEAKNCFQEGLKEENDAGLRQWSNWCDDKMEKLKTHGDKAPTNTPQQEHPQPPKAEEIVPLAKVEPKIKHDWYQTETCVVVEVRIKNAKSDDVKVKFTDKSLSVDVVLPNGRNYSLELNLAHPVTAAQCSYKIFSTKIEIKLKKVDGTRWPTLEAAENTESAAPTVYPSSSGKNWDKIEGEIAKELAKDKPEGEAALNELFQKIFSEGNDDLKKAMNKSFSESGGTVLSTNWEDIKKEKVTVKPPDGMEFKKW